MDQPPPRSLDDFLRAAADRAAGAGLPECIAHEFMLSRLVAASSRVPAPGSPLRWGAIALPVAVGAVTFVTFLPTLAFDFVSHDDPAVLLGNVAYRGLGWQQVRWAFTSTHMGLYMPLTWLSWSADYVAWGLNPRGYHLGNVALHTVSAVLLYFVIVEILGRDLSSRVGSAGAAVLWAIHPLRVESVAWVTERKDVLCGALFLLAAWLFLTARDRWALLAFVGSLLAKPMAVTLPAALVVVEVMLRRPVRLSRYLPFIVLSVVISLVAKLALPGSGFVRPTVLVDSSSRYVISSIWPMALSPLYQDVGITPFRLGVCAVVAALAWRWAAVRWALVGYLVMLAPVSGVLAHGRYLVADHFSYIPTLAFAVLAGAGLAWAVRTVPRYAAALILTLMLALVITTGRQLEVWRDSVSLWGHAARLAPTSAEAGYFYAGALEDAARTVDAIREYRRVSRMPGREYESLNNLGGLLLAQGDQDGARAAFRAAISIRHGPAACANAKRLGENLCE
jgi:hypothetical protein